ncbi:MAG TPA: HAD family hydrolase, partial [Longimicrobium sp.]|nr:HAD family hydrolase [Longimicrobium sp.]
MMSTTPRVARASRLLLALLLVAAAPRANGQGGADPLPSWNDGPAKQAITSFVQRVTAPGGPDFVPVEDRIAAFDNDGTLWAEKPLPTEVYFVLARVRELAARDPSLAGRQPFKAALEGDAAYFHEAGPEAVLQLLALTHAGMTQEEFAYDALRFLASERHPALHRPFTGAVYQPMLELLAYLRANGFQTWISSGGTLDFIRVFAPVTYGVPPERTIGSELQRQSRRAAGRLSIVRLPRPEHLNDKDGKPVGIDRHIGRRPLLVAGNVLSGG